MVAWDLEPGSERPVAARQRRNATLTAPEIVRRCEQLGARVERAGGGGHRVFPPDRARPPVSVPSQLAHGRGHLNVITALRRAGLEVLAEPVPKETSVPAAKTPADVPARKVGASAATIAELRDQLAELREQVTGLREQVTGLLEMLAEADTRDHQLGERVDQLAARLDATPGAPPDRDPHAALDEAILALMARVPINLTAPLIAGNLSDAAANEEAVAGRLRALCAAGKAYEDADADTWGLIRHETTAGDAA